MAVSSVKWNGTNVLNGAISCDFTTFNVDDDSVDLDVGHFAR